MADWMPAPPPERMWGIVLNSENKSQVWPSPDHLSEDAKLELSQATLGVGAKKDERNVIEMKVLTEEKSTNYVSFPIVSLKEGLLEHATLNLNLNPPVVFKLASGSGPVSLMGVEHYLSDDTESESDDGYDADESLMVKDEALKKGKKRKAEDSPAETKKSKADTKDLSKATNGEKKKEGIIKALAGDDDDDDDSSNSELDLGDDFGESSSIDKNESDSQDDDDDDIMEDTPEVKDKGKGKKQTKKGDKPNVPVEKKKSPEKKGGKIDGKALEAVKNKLRSNKTLPKSEDKFKNFVKGLKVSDPGQISELWKFVEKLRKT